VLIVRRALAVVGAVVLGAALLVPASSAVAADDCTLVEAGIVDGVMTYQTVCPGDEQAGGDHGGGGGSGDATPACDTSTVENVGDYVFCVGTTACAVNNPSHIDEDEWPTEGRPGPDYIYTFKWCTTAAGDTDYGWSWYLPADDGPSLEELARQAFGELAAPDFSVGFNPPGRTIVGYDTWLWARTGQAGALRGTSAQGVVAVAQPAHMDVDPGDGTGTRACPWSTSESADCSVTYVRSSAGQPADGSGDPAYRARARLVYDVHFEQNGTRLDLDGLPTTFASPWSSVAIPVAEVQSVVSP